MKMKKYFIISLLFLIGVSAAWFVYSSNAVTKVIADTLRLDDQEATMRAINKVMPAVVSIIIIDQQSKPR